MSFIDDAKRLVEDGEVREESMDLLADSLDALTGNTLSAGKVIKALIQSPFFLRDKLLWLKIEQYLNGVYVSEEDRAMLRAKLVENGSSQENSKRLLECIDRAETSSKIQYLINATRCFLVDFIDRTTFFRICRAIIGTIDEDLLFLRNHIEEHDFRYNQSIQGLFVSGLLTFSSIGGEETLYSFTPLAHMVDRYAISYEDVARYPDPTTVNEIVAPNVDIPTATVDEVTETLRLPGAPRTDVVMSMGEF